MKQSITLPIVAFAAIALVSCGSKGRERQSQKYTQDATPVSTVLADAPLAAEKIVVGGDTVIVAKLSSEPSPITLLASDMFDEFDLIKLEDTDEALTGGGQTWVSDGHILIYDGNQIKLYDRKGKYIANVGARGQGPGEYSIAPYYLTVDEKNGKIYMMQYIAKNINIYDLKDGDFIRNIPLAFDAPKGFCKVDADKGEIIVASMQFKDDSPSSPVWVQDFEGKVISAISRPDLELTPDFSNEINPSMTYDGSQIYHSQVLITGMVADTVYRSDGKTMHPVFTYDFGKEIPMHSMQAFPQFFVMTSYGDPVAVDENSWVVGGGVPLVVDRKTLKGSPATLMIDQLGTLSLKKGWEEMSTPGYFSKAYDPGDLLDMLHAAPDSHPLANEEGLKKMEELRNSIDPEGNHYVMIGHWRE